MKNGNVCEVAQKFTIGIERETDENMPLVFNVYKDASCVESVEQDENGNYTSDDFKLNAGGEGETKTCYLKISWPADENNIELSYEMGYLKINVIVTQID